MNLRTDLAELEFPAILTEPEASDSFLDLVSLLDGRFVEQRDAALENDIRLEISPAMGERLSFLPQAGDLGTVVGLSLSAAVHLLALFFLAHALVFEGLDADQDAISVEIVFDDQGLQATFPSQAPETPLVTQSDTSSETATAEDLGDTVVDNVSSAPDAQMLDQPSEERETSEEVAGTEPLGFDSPSETAAEDSHITNEPPLTEARAEEEVVPLPDPTVSSLADPPLISEAEPVPEADSEPSRTTSVRAAAGYVSAPFAATGGDAGTTTSDDTDRATATVFVPFQPLAVEVPAKEPQVPSPDPSVLATLASPPTSGLASDPANPIDRPNPAHDFIPPQLDAEISAALAAPLIVPADVTSPLPSVVQVIPTLAERTHMNDEPKGEGEAVTDRTVPAAAAKTDGKTKKKATALPRRERPKATDIAPGDAASAGPRKKTPNGASKSMVGQIAKASASEQASYAKKLLAHVQRFKRYPPAAQKAGITGNARLSITIDRSGRLKGARLGSSAGNATLDAEALAVARRAAPYPVPPDGVGSQTFSFSVTLKFSR
ncbi:energy transducer TonB [Aminobacter ciceronei]|uniref:TonB family protein n=1 Tax=Aminobacter ciceronei TaxID=150723 RepID=A0ABR6CA21_9HYPH|nr:energy transducer TonB [Aminobacter ciceronei]MBA8907976.1 TonB family protein [Aminobacter ciceronei]MBA9021731.1 TonB family protein [Aminobacter ciceronei]